MLAEKIPRKSDGELGKGLQTLEIKEVFGFARRDRGNQNAVSCTAITHTFSNTWRRVQILHSRNMCVLLWSQRFSARLPQYYMYTFRALKIESNSRRTHTLTHNTGEKKLYIAGTYLGLWLRRRGGGRV